MRLPALEIQQPDVGRSLLAAESIKGHRTRNRLMEAQLKRDAELPGLRAEAMGLGGGGSSGLPGEAEGAPSPEATAAGPGGINMNKLKEFYAKFPKEAERILKFSQDATKAEAEQARGQAAKMAKPLMYIESLPKEQRAMAYAQIIGKAKASGQQFKNPPPDKYDPQWVNNKIMESMMIDKAAAYVKNRQEKPPVGFTGGPDGLRPIPGGPADPSYKGRVSDATREPTQQYSGEVELDSEVGKFYQVNPKNGKREYISPNEEFSIESTAEGGFRISKGAATGKGGLTKKTTANIEKKLFDAKEGLARIKGIQSKFRPEYQQIETRVGAAWTGLKSKLGGEIDEDSKELLTDFSAYKQEAIGNINDYIKEITGAAMGIQEAKRIRKAVPDPGEGIFDGDDPIAFKSKMDNAVSMLEKARARYEYYLKKGITNKHEMAEKSPLSKMDIAVNPETKERLINVEGEWIPL